MNQPAGSAKAPRRAPRLAPNERIAPYITRRGRFRRIDPSAGRPLPRWGQWLGVAAWLGLLLESVRRARQAHDTPEG